MKWWWKIATYFKDEIKNIWTENKYLLKMFNFLRHWITNNFWKKFFLLITLQLPEKIGQKLIILWRMYQLDSECWLGFDRLLTKRSADMWYMNELHLMVSAQNPPLKHRIYPLYPARVFDASLYFDHLKRLWLWSWTPLLKRHCPPDFSFITVVSITSI